MLKRLKKIFIHTKNEETQQEIEEEEEEEKEEDKVVSAITVYTDGNFDVFVDVNMRDYSDVTIDHLSSLMTMFNSENFFQVSSILKEQCSSTNNDELYVKIIEKTVSKIGTEDFLEDYHKKSDKICVNPSDML